MSGKIKSKDLSYDSALPPFLQRLHDQKAGRGDVDRHEREIARPKRARDADADAEDESVVVDERGEVVNLKEVEDKAVEGVADAERREQTVRVVEAGTAGKRKKVIKVVAEGKQKAEVEDEVKAVDAVKTAGPVKPVKKKAKRAVKLAFDDEDG